MQDRNSAQDLEGYGIYNQHIATKVIYPGPCIVDLGVQGSRASFKAL